jgi:hypothetical protein
MLQTPWTDRRTNASIIDEVKPKRSLEATITQPKLRYFGHVMITNGTLEWDIMIGQVDGSRRQGRPRLRWIDSIKENTGFGLYMVGNLNKTKITVFSVDNAHLRYNVHPRLFRHSF